MVALPSLLLPVLGNTRVPFSGMARLGLSSRESQVAAGKARGFSVAEGCCELLGVTFQPGAARNGTREETWGISHAVIPNANVCSQHGAGTCTKCEGLRFGTMCRHPWPRRV